ncbi:hypothetical protein [Streptomyces lichenis]|uniref:Uncharacterized protein n=1 Tax=Streptomyces lichenis TaxID=2306967 RepID=A0ABT0IFZ8_9ACTN|nr:hypothetical protein [Streptomyces lichenis]MCK8680257.1 hypothetical protein [Streptomyces lichenis]
MFDCAFDFGIEGFQPEWREGVRDLRHGHGHRLGALVGRPLTRTWLVWDLEEDRWFADCPVLLDFDGQRVELVHNTFDDLSVTWSTIDPRRPVRWPGADFVREWRPDPLPELQALCGSVLHRVELLEWTGPGPAHGNVEVSFVFPGGRIGVFNAMDENGLTFAPPLPELRVHCLE